MTYRRTTRQQYNRYSPIQRRMGRLEAKIYSNQWQVPSRSSPGKFYKVSVTPNGEWECSCPDWTYRRNECKHIKQVKNSIGNLASPPKKKPRTGQLTIGDLIEEGPQEARQARCPSCGSTSFRYRKGTDDYACRNCGEILTPML